MSIDKNSQIKKSHLIETHYLLKILDAENLMKYSKLVVIEEQFIQNISQIHIISGKVFLN